MITAQTILLAHERIKPFIHQTPVMTSAGIDAMVGAKVFFKCENFQKVGAFKARGAMNAILCLTSAERSKGVATHSSGNHGQAIARAAHLMGVDSYIVMPHTVAAMKKRGVLGFGGQIFECEATLQSRVSTLKEVVEKTGAVEIHPFNNYDVIAGQATAAKELFDEINDLDVITVPVGGGGLLSGTALTTKYFSPTTIVIAGEPNGADDAYRSMQSGKIELSQANSIADGLLTSLGDKTYPIIRDHVHEVNTVSDDEIVHAMKVVWEWMKIIIEPSAAVPLAAVLKSKEKFQGKKIGIILSGGNVDLERALSLMTRQGTTS